MIVSAWILLIGSKSHCGSQCSKVNVKEAVWESVFDRQCLDHGVQVKESLWESDFGSSVRKSMSRSQCLIISVVLSASKGQSVWCSVRECYGVSVRGRHLDASVQGSLSKSCSRSQHFLMSASGGRSQRSGIKEAVFRNRNSLPKRQRITDTTGSSGRRGIFCLFS